MHFVHMHNIMMYATIHSHTQYTHRWMEEPPRRCKCWHKKLVKFNVLSPSLAPSLTTHAQISKFQSDNKLELTVMVPKLTGVHPDDAFSKIPYEKGAVFLFYLETLLGGPGKLIFSSCHFFLQIINCIS